MCSLTINQRNQWYPWRLSSFVIVNRETTTDSGWHLNQSDRPAFGLLEANRCPGLKKDSPETEHFCRARPLFRMQIAAVTLLEYSLTLRLMSRTSLHKRLFLPHLVRNCRRENFKWASLKTTSCYTSLSFNSLRVSKVCVQIHFLHNPVCNQLPRRSCQSVRARPLTTVPVEIIVFILFFGFPFPFA